MTDLTKQADFLKWSFVIEICFPVETLAMRRVGNRPTSQQGGLVNSPVIERGKCLGVKTEGELEKRAFVGTAGRKERSGFVQLLALLVPLNAGRCLSNGEPSWWLNVYIWNWQFHKIHFCLVSIISKLSKKIMLMIIGVAKLYCAARSRFLTGAYFPFTRVQFRGPI